MPVFDVLPIPPSYVPDNCHNVTEIEIAISLDSLIAEETRKRLQFVGTSLPYKSITANVRSNPTRLSFDVALNVSWIPLVFYLR